MSKLCMDCKQPIDPGAFPDFAKSEKAKRCAECTIVALWQLTMGDWDSELDDPAESEATP